jgi:hypothetical protein
VTNTLAYFRRVSDEYKKGFIRLRIGDDDDDDDRHLFDEGFSIFDERTGKQNSRDKKMGLRHFVERTFPQPIDI